MALKLYWSRKDNITEDCNLLVYGNRILIPFSLQLRILDKLNPGHQDITKARSHANQSVWWPGTSKEIADLVTNCRTCIELHKNQTEPVLPTATPPLP